MNQNQNKSDQKQIKKFIVGQVVSIKTQQTIGVSVKRSFRNKLYKKIIKRDTRYLVHNEKKDIAIGDTVKIVETKPISKKKHFLLIEKVQS